MEKEFLKSFKFCDVSFSYVKSEIITEREMHDYHELLFYIDGAASLLTENYTKELKAPSLIFIPKGKYHFFSPKIPENFTRLKISFENAEIEKSLPEDFFKEIKIAEDFETASIALLLEAEKRFKKEALSECDKIYIYGAFLSVISSFSEMNTKAPERRISRIVSDAIDFIEKNLKDELSLEAISKNIGISPSLLSHTFKREMGITPHSYVSQKRLFYAKALLNEGERPTDIFSLCGYRDYSSFYKAYTKAFKKRPRD
jgi:AraC-like DNA-binding protein